MFKKTQSISLKDSCSPVGNNFTVNIDTKRNVGHYAVVSRNIVTVSSNPLEGSSATKPVNRPFTLRDPTAKRLSHIVQVSSVSLFMCRKSVHVGDSTIRSLVKRLSRTPHKI